MTLGEKLARLRKERNYTQEQLAEILGVSRQAISKWESNAAYPETEKLIRLAQMYDCSLDYLVLDKPMEKEKQVPVYRLDLSNVCIEKVSEKKIGNLPLWHINIGFGRVAKGVFSLGFISTGVFSAGLISMGVVSAGVLGIGLLTFGSFALGLVSVGAIAAGILAFGAVAFGVFAAAASAIGEFAVGAAALGSYAAFGDAATAAIAVGMSEAKGTLYQTLMPLQPGELEQIRLLLNETVPQWLNGFKELFLLFLR